MMNLLDLMVKIGVQDEASGKVGGIASNITGGLGKAVAGVAKIGAAATAAAAGAMPSRSSCGAACRSCMVPLA
jgi:hypothetical protein